MPAAAACRLMIPRSCATGKQPLEMSHCATKLATRACALLFSVGTPTCVIYVLLVHLDENYLDGVISCQRQNLERFAQCHPI